VSSLYTARHLQSVVYSLPSYGTFSTSIKTSYLFGSIPRNFVYSGFSMDIDNLATIAESKTHKDEDRINYVRAIGYASSAYEHEVPQRLFAPMSNPDDPVQSISAVKALAIAGEEGQKLYSLNSSNSNLLSNITIDQDARNEIISALFSGKEVTLHEHPITTSGFTGSGYIIIDPLTGAGAYKISGGNNGSDTPIIKLKHTGYIFKSLAVVAWAFNQPYL
jgi:hypothetical protein